MIHLLKNKYFFFKIAIAAVILSYHDKALASIDLITIILSDNIILVIIERGGRGKGKRISLKHFKMFLIISWGGMFFF